MAKAETGFLLNVYETDAGNPLSLIADVERGQREVAVFRPDGPEWAIVRGQTPCGRMSPTRFVYPRLAGYLNLFRQMNLAGWTDVLQIPEETVPARPGMIYALSHHFLFDPTQPDIIYRVLRSASNQPNGTVHSLVDMLSCEKDSRHLMRVQLDFFPSGQAARHTLENHYILEKTPH